MKAVELVPGQDGEELPDLGGGIELAGDVEMAAAKAHARRVDNLALAGKQEDSLVTPRAAQNLPQRDQAIEVSAAARSLDRNLGLAEGEAISFLAMRALGKAHDHAAFRGIAHQALGRKQALRQIGEGSRGGALRFRQRRRRKAGRRRAAAGNGNRVRPGNDGDRDGRVHRHGEAGRAAFQRPVVALRHGARHRNARNGLVGENEIGRVRAIAPVAQRIGQAARRDDPGGAGLQDKSVRRRQLGVVGQALRQRAVFKRRGRIEASRSADGKAKILDRRAGIVGEPQRIGERLAFARRRPAGFKVKWVGRVSHGLLSGKGVLRDLSCTAPLSSQTNSPQGGDWLAAMLLPITSVPERAVSSMRAISPLKREMSDGTVGAC